VGIVMCLEIKKRLALYTAKKDKVVYKYIEKRFGGYVTPYQGFPIKIGHKYTSDLKVEKDYYNIVEIGLHSFKNKKDAIEVANKYYEHYIVKCIIPKGSKYYVGTFDIGSGLYGHKYMTSYASNEIIYVELV
jgi:hypothetical protein